MACVKTHLNNISYNLGDAIREAVVMCEHISQSAEREIIEDLIEGLNQLQRDTLHKVRKTFERTKNINACEV